MACNGLHTHVRTPLLATHRTYTYTWRELIYYLYIQINSETGLFAETIKTALCEMYTHAKRYRKMHYPPYYRMLTEKLNTTGYLSKTISIAKPYIYIYLKGILPQNPPKVFLRFHWINCIIKLSTPYFEWGVHVERVVLAVVRTASTGMA